MNFVTGSWRDTYQRPLCGLNTIPASHFRLDEPALLRRAELLNHRVEARLPLPAVVAIDSHVFLLSADFDSVARTLRVREASLHGLAPQIRATRI